jgi:hypothetical protein
MTLHFTVFRDDNTRTIRVSECADSASAMEQSCMDCHRGPGRHFEHAKSSGAAAYWHARRKHVLPWLEQGYADKSDSTVRNATP